MKVPGVRKLVVTSEWLLLEGGREVESPMHLCTAAVVMKNPWSGRGFVEDLKPDIARIAPPLADVLVDALRVALGDLLQVQAYGKAAVVGVEGEIEHASALIHTLRFGNRFRDAVAGTTYLPFTNRRGGPGCSIQVPLMHITDAGFRTHYLTSETTIGDAPAADELVIAIAAATGGRPFARIGNRYEDMSEMETGGAVT